MKIYIVPLLEINKILLISRSSFQKDRQAAFKVAKTQQEPSNIYGDERQFSKTWLMLGEAATEVAKAILVNSAM